MIQTSFLPTEIKEGVSDLTIYVHLAYSLKHPPSIKNAATL